MRMRKAGDEERGCGFLRFLSPSRNSLFLLCAVKNVDSAEIHSTLHMTVGSRLADANVLSVPFTRPHPCAAGTGVFSPQCLWWARVRIRGVFRIRFGSLLETDRVVGFDHNLSNS